MLPSVKAQKPEATGASWASVDVRLAVMMEVNALSPDLILPIHASQKPVNRADRSPPESACPSKSAGHISHPCLGNKVKLGLQIRRQRRAFFHQCDRHATIRRQR